MSRAGTVGKLVAVALFAAILLAPNPVAERSQSSVAQPGATAQPATLSLPAQRLAAVTALMAVLWLTQALPMAATSLIPLAAFPLLGIQTAEEVSHAYIDASVFLFLGGFIIALGIEKWGLHRRIALHIVRLVGSGPRRMVLGFMLATAFLSMWISNTAATLLMLPIGLALVSQLVELSRGDAPPTVANAPGASAIDRFTLVLLLGIAYAASIGGFTTLVGTPTNVQFQKIWAETFPAAPRFSVGLWMAAVVPIGVLYLLLAWGVLTWGLPPLPGGRRFDRRFFTDRLRALGPPSGAEIRMFLVFAVTAALWITRKAFAFGETEILPGWGDWVSGRLTAAGVDPEIAREAMHDSVVAIGMALAMFVIPARRDEFGRTEYLMDWETAERLPWGILLLIGGGFALADAFQSTGLSAWVGGAFAQAVAGWPVWLLVAAVCFLLTFLTELTSNVATISTILPVLAGTAVAIEVDPRLIMVPATIATSCAFMLPIATPPNAIIFGSGRVSIGQMARYGIWLNLLGVVLITAATFLLLVPQLGISLTTPPTWSQP
ncbi:MAG: SLC13 family permease [Planctomycetes bacterium]|nr:SLC13 family permease [Planctomycetota bacterium]